MTTRTYAPTVNPGDTRTRCPELMFRMPADQPYRIEAYEEVRVRLANGTERTLERPGQVEGIPALDITDPAVLAQPVQIYDPATNALIPGATMTVGQIFAGMFSFIHGHQLARDARDAAQAAVSTQTQEPT